MRLFLLFAVACGGPQPDGICDDLPDTPVPHDRVLSNVDSCGFYDLEIDEHLIVNHSVSEPEVACSEVLGAGLELNAAPVYSNFGDDGPKYTWDVVGKAVTVDDYVTVEFTCDDGSAWQARVVVIE
jgi:hypothetical protein